MPPTDASTATSPTESTKEPSAFDGVEGAVVTEPMTIPQQRAAVFRTQGGRETLEAFAVAFILALLFRAFVAEAFVIPTGSMAPSLMGAHKDVFCDQCGQQFPVGASLENREVAMENVVVGGICPNCRHVNSFDFANDPAHETFSGDRILVSKFAYAISDPERWDVIVFKVPVNPKQNYIKRLVGLPNETISILHGDIYAKPTEPESNNDDQPLTGGAVTPLGTILRKPPEKILAMSHMVYDSDHQAQALIDAAYPARLQPWASGVETPPTDSWSVQRSEDGLTASVETSGDATAWLRYFHRSPNQQQWLQAIDGLSLANVDPYQSRLVTDFHAYDSYLHVDADRIYDQKPVNAGVLGKYRSGGVFRSSFRPGEGISQFRDSVHFGANGYEYEGVHWVGDLITAMDVETSTDSQALTLEIVEAGIRYQCEIDLKTGTATLSINDGQTRAFDELAGGKTNATPTANTNVKAGKRHRIRLSNCDNELVLWVDDEVVTFDTPTTFDVSSFLPRSQVQPRYNGPGDPLDAAPIAVGVQGGTAKLRRFQVDRDKYYIATQQSNYGMLDYDMADLNNFVGQTVRIEEIQSVMGEPEIWSEFPGWKTRRSVSFRLEADQFFPMGDNSPESLDARCWAGTKVRLGRYRSVDEDSYKFANVSYVPRDLLVGKALAIFWPHPWNSPLPIWPNFQRMQLIR